MSVTIKDIAGKLDVSIATVSRVLNRREDPFISEKTKLRVREMAREMGYTPNRAARALVTGRTNMIELQIPPFMPFNVEVNHYLHNLLNKAGYDVIVHDLLLSSDASIAPRQSWPVDGILSMASQTALETYSEENSTKTPIVSMGASFWDTLDHVGLDLYPGTLDAINHLISMKCERIAYCASDSSDILLQARGRAYSDALMQANLEPEYILSADSSRATVHATVVEHITEHGAPDAIFCHNDDRAIATFRALCDLGLSVPDDVALVGCDGIEDTLYINPTITTIVTPIEEMCSVAWEFLQNRMKDPQMGIQGAVLRPHLEIRRSSSKQHS